MLFNRIDIIRVAEIITSFHLFLIIVHHLCTNFLRWCIIAEEIQFNSSHPIEKGICFISIKEGQTGYFLSNEVFIHSLQIAMKVIVYLTYVDLSPCRSSRDLEKPSPSNIPRYFLSITIYWFLSIVDLLTSFLFFSLRYVYPSALINNNNTLTLRGSKDSTKSNSKDSFNMRRMKMNSSGKFNTLLSEIYR